MGNAFQKNPNFDNEADDTSEHDTDLLLECVSFQCRRKKKIDPETEALKARKRESLIRVQKENEDRARRLREEAQQRRYQELERQRKEIEEEERQKREAREAARRRKEESADSNIGLFNCFKSREKTPHELAEEEKKRKEAELAKQHKRAENEKEQLEKERAKAEKERDALAKKEKKRKEKDEANKLKAMEKERKRLDRNEAERRKMQQDKEKKAERERKRREMKDYNSVSSIDFFPCFKRREKTPAELAAEEYMRKQREEAERLESFEKEKKRLEQEQAKEREREERKLRENELRMQREKEEEAAKREREERRLRENEMRIQAERQRAKEEAEKREENQRKSRELENKVEAEKRRVEEYQRQFFERDKPIKPESAKPINEKEKRPKVVVATESDNSSLHESDLELKWCGTLKKPRKKGTIIEEEKTKPRVKIQPVPKKESKTDWPEPKTKLEPEPAKAYVEIKKEPVLTPIKETLSEIKLEPESAVKAQSAVPPPMQCPPCPTIEVVEKRIQEAQTEPIKCLQPVEMKEKATLVTPSLSLEGKDMHKDGLDKTSFKSGERETAPESQRGILDKPKDMIKKPTEDSTVQTDENLLENLLGLNIKNQPTATDTKLEKEKERPTGTSSTQTEEALLEKPLSLRIKEEPIGKDMHKLDFDKSKKGRWSTEEASCQEEDKTSYEFMCGEYLKNDAPDKGTSSTKNRTTSSAQTDENLLKTLLAVKIKEEPIDSDTTRKNLEKEIEALERSLNIKKEVTQKQERSNEDNKPNTISTNADKKAHATVDTNTQTDDITQLDAQQQQRLHGNEATTVKKIYIRDQGNQTEPWRFDYYDSSEKILIPYSQSSDLVVNENNNIPTVSNVSEGTQTDCMCDCFAQTSVTEREAILRTNPRKIIKNSVSTQTDICTCNFVESSSSSYLSTECMSQD